MTLLPEFIELANSLTADITLSSMICDCRTYFLPLNIMLVNRHRCRKHFVSLLKFGQQGRITRPKHERLKIASGQRIVTVMPSTNDITRL